jgi:hypothetical protein
MDQDLGLVKNEFLRIIVLGPFDNEFGDTFDATSRYAQNVT